MRSDGLMIAFKALTQLGLEPVALNALYRFGLATGHYNRVTSRQSAGGSGQLKAVLPLPCRADLLNILGEEGKTRLLAEADEIVAGKARLFGGEPVDLKLTVDGPLAPWTDYETGKARHAGDIKFIWEPARFGWAFTLGRAYYISDDENYSDTFWRNTGKFLDANPPFLGPNWMSGQEVALRMMAFIWTAQVFSGSLHSTPERLARLARSVADHADRIIPTLIYARSQNNNHLLTEAAGLLTAGLALPEHSSAAKWCKLGWKWLNAGFRSQIDSYGEYSQHSTNYHRLMLQVALWVNAMFCTNDFSSIPYSAFRGRLTREASQIRYPPETTEALRRASHWLLALLDPVSGRTPNLGANDGAYIFPLTICPFNDYRPMVHAAARAFLDYDLPHGSWDEMSLWFGIPLARANYLQLPRYPGDQIYGYDSWASLRTAQFKSRPSHADQLHLDLWWRGLNIAQDAGTYLYNAAQPWENSLTTALVHNTVTVEGRDQFTRAGRFLYLDWFSAWHKEVVPVDERILQQVSGEHHGYRWQNVHHTREVIAYTDGRWEILDKMVVMRFARQKKALRFRLHWLLPDWEWKAEKSDSSYTIRIRSPHEWVSLRLSIFPVLPFTISLTRAGEALDGKSPDSPIMGWVSPTYGVKVPALSLALEVVAAQDFDFISRFIFPNS